MNRKTFTKYLTRDKQCVCGCNSTDTLVPQHRANRGMGGSPALDRPANVIVMCARLNGLIESDPRHAAIARRYGWKLERWQTPEETPVYYVSESLWFTIDNDFNRKEHSPWREKQ
ncbi:hypothetical protein [Glutamicibacter sp. X7]